MESFTPQRFEGSWQSPELQSAWEESEEMVRYHKFFESDRKIFIPKQAPKAAPVPCQHHRVQAS